MSPNTKILIALSALVIMALGVPMAAAQGSEIQYQHSAGTVTLTTDDIAIRVTSVGEVPHFLWWDPNNTDIDYHVMFVKLFEAIDNNSNGAFDLGTDKIVGPPFALPSADWEFSGFVTEMDGDKATAVHFNFTSTTTHTPRPSEQNGDYGSLPNITSFDIMVQIRVHMSLANPGEMKFDVLIGGWVWTYTDSMLVLQFTVAESDHGLTQGDRDPAGFNQTGTQFSFGNGYIQYEGTALAAQNTIQVRASHGAGTCNETGESVYLTFANFGNTTLEYDPTLGIVASSSSVPSTLPDLTTPILMVSAATIATIAAIVIVVAVKVRK